MQGAKNIILSIALLVSSFCSAQKSIIQLEKEAAQQFEIGKYADALNTRLEILKIAEKSKNCKKIAFAYWQLGRMQYFTKDISNALKTNFTAKRYIDSCNVDTLKGIINNNIGAMFHTLGNIDSALVYYNNAISILSKTNRYNDISRIHALVAKLYLNKEGVKNIAYSKTHYDLALKNAEKSNDYSSIFFVQLGLADYYNVTHNIPKATEYAQKAYDLVNLKNGKIEEKIYATRVLAQELALAENPKIKDLYDQFLILRDSVFKIETSTKIADYKVLYETEKKETQNKLLQQENSIIQSKIDARNKTIIGLLICVALIVILIAWRLNVIKLKKKLAEIENEKKLQHDRERISRDLHDNVGGQLSYVMFSLEGNEELTQEKRINKNHQLANALRDVTGNLRETIWALNKQELTLQDIADKLKLYTRNIFAYQDVKLKFEENITNDISLNPVYALNLFRICQEIINNVFKHANATELTITFKKNENITIAISDNGSGFNIDSTKENSFGLTSLKSRAEEINAIINIESAINKGTIITLVV